MFCLCHFRVTNLPSAPALPFRSVAKSAFVETNERAGASSQPGVISTKLVLTFRELLLQVLSRTGTCPKTFWLSLGQICVLRFFAQHRIILTFAPSAWSTL